MYISSLYERAGAPQLVALLLLLLFALQCVWFIEQTRTRRKFIEDNALDVKNLDI